MVTMQVRHAESDKYSRKAQAQCIHPQHLNIWYFSQLSTVEQENFASGNFRDFRPQTIRMQDIFANLGVEGLLSFYLNQEIFTGRKFSRISRKLQNSKICCSTVFIGLPLWIGLTM